jgi:hypothetical protein
MHMGSACVLLCARDALPPDNEGRAGWRHEAIIAAILGSCPKTLQSTLPGLNHWIQFIKATYGAAEADSKILPPKLGDVIAWSSAFR